jgi:hypothetical protein
MFNPLSTNDIMSFIYPYIFTLFPRVTALKMLIPAKAPASLPKS